MALSLGKMPTRSVRRLIAPLIRARGLHEVPRKRRQEAEITWRMAFFRHPWLSEMTHITPRKPLYVGPYS